jgi:N-methylhydantoinase A
VSSTVDNYATAIVDGLTDLTRERNLEAPEIVEFLHGTTVASNAILELKGARTGLITTKGFRDVLEIRTLRMPRLYDLAWTKPPPLVERYLRVEVDERIKAKGEVERPLSEADAARAIEKLLDDGVQVIAVCLILSYHNPTHEQLVKRVAGRMAPDVTLCISSEVLPEIKEYERTSTTVINAYVRPIVERYLATLTADLARIGVDAPLLLMQSNGGLTTAKAAAVTPMNIIESGAGGGCRRDPGVDPADRRRKRDLVRHGRHHGQGFVDRKWRAQPCPRILVRRRRYDRLAAVVGCRLHTQGSCDRPGGGRCGSGSVIWIDAGGALQIGRTVPGPLRVRSIMISAALYPP